MTEGDLLVYFCGSISLTLLLATSIFVFFSKDSLSRLVGWFAMKPVIAYGSWITILLLGLGTWTSLYIFYAVIEMFLLLVIFFQFKTSYQKNFWTFWLFTLLDFARWGSMFFILASTDIFGIWGVDRNMARMLLTGIMFYSTLFALFGCLFSIVRRQKTYSTRENS